MEEIYKEFEIPYYIFEEIVEYIEQTKGRCRYMKCENIKALLRLSQAKDRLNATQVKYIIDTHCKEWNIIKINNYIKICQKVSKFC